jgi:hypothetical protein
MPSNSGTATVTYFTATGQVYTQPVPLTAGIPVTLDVNAELAAYYPGGVEVSTQVAFPANGVAERKLSFNRNGWQGSTDVVGATQTSNVWNFAEGSTLSVFSEYLTLENPNSSAVVATLNYFTDSGANPIKTVTLPASSRTTIPVFVGNPANSQNCTPAVDCGIGVGLGGVSVQVQTDPSTPIVAERPMYVNGFGFQGPTPIHDGDVSAGAIAAAKTWDFAEGSTLPGFWEYLSLENPSGLSTNATLTYQLQSGGPIAKAVPIAAHSRVTVEVFNPLYGVGSNQGGVSVHIASDSQPIVAERPMYMAHDFGTGMVAGATVVVGSNGASSTFEFAQADTLVGDFDYLTLQNSGSTDASVTIKNYNLNGQLNPTQVTVKANSRKTVQIFSDLGAIGTQSEMGLVIASTQPILVEKPTYSTLGNGGATDTTGFTPLTP